MFRELHGYRDQQLDLTELVEAANRAIGRAGLDPDDERVADRIDGRTVRYYQSLGLVSKPLGYEGRSARYGYPHLLQLVAIKALQAAGLGLAHMGGWLPARPVEALQAALAGSLSAGAPPPVSEKPGQGPGSRLSFNLRDPGPAHEPTEPESLTAFRLAPGLTLLVDPDQVADPEAIARRLQILLEAMD